MRKWPGIRENVRKIKYEYISCKLFSKVALVQNFPGFMMGVRVEVGVEVISFLIKNRKDKKKSGKNQPSDI